jgi:hypothetical protein
MGRFLVFPIPAHTDRKEKYKIFIKVSLLVLMILFVTFNEKRLLSTYRLRVREEGNVKGNLCLLEEGLIPGI